MIHGREARAERLIVRPPERIAAHHRHQADLVADEHQVAGAVGRVDPAGRVGDDQRVDAQLVHHPHRQSDLLERRPLVGVDPPLHDEHVMARQPADHQLPGVAGHRGRREVRHIGEGQAIGVGDLVGQRVQPGAEDHPDGGPVAVRWRMAAAAAW